jgi:hypothetical protein
MNYLNLQDLYTALKEHYADYGYNGSGLGTTLDWFIEELILAGYSPKLIKKMCNLAYYK